MVDNQFYRKSGPYPLAFIAKSLDCELPSEFSDILITDIKAINEAQKHDLTFLTNKKYLPALKSSKASACIIPTNLAVRAESNIKDSVLLKSQDPYLAYAKATYLFYASAKQYTATIMPSAYISPTATIGNDCYIGHNVVIEDKVNIGNDCIIESGTIIDFGVKIGNNTKLCANVFVSYANIGDNVLILPGAKIGQDGFGFATKCGKHHKIYHTGKVLIGNNVEIGANTTIDRGSVSDTIIEDWCKIDNLVQIAHNVKIGRGTIIVAQVGIAGSSQIGSYCILAGQVGISGHLTIADKVQIAGQGGVMQDIKDEGLIMGGAPAVPIRDWHKQTIIMKKLVRDK